MLNAVRMLMLLILCTELTPQTAKSSELKKHGNDLERLVSVLRPTLSKSEVKMISSGLIKASSDKSCKVPLLILLSVAYKESTLNKDARNERTKDYGIMQINEDTIIRLKLDKKKLMKDPHYSFKIGCYLLTENKQKYSKKRPYWLGIYNSGTALKRDVVVRNAKKYDTDLKKVIKMVEKTKAQLSIK